MNRKITFSVLLLTAVALGWVPDALGGGGPLNNQYMLDFRANYTFAVGTRIDNCLLCHANPSGGTPLNFYGMDFSGHNFTAIELNDPDNDGFTNIEEIHNLTFPGNQFDLPPVITGSTPTTAVVDSVMGIPTTFTVTVNQPLNVTWHINGTQVQDSATIAPNNQSTYSNSIAGQGIWNVTAVAHKGAATAVHSWIWNVGPSVTVPTFSISGFKINSSDGVGIPDWTITLTNATMTVPTITDANGMYLFTGLENDTYTVSETLKQGWTNVTPISIDVIIGGADMTNQNFTNQPIPPAPTPDFIAILSGGEEVPPVTTQAQGQATFNLNLDSLHFKLVVSNITNATVSHIHLAPSGVNGPIVVTLYPGPTIVGGFDGVLAEGNITTENLTGLLAGMPLSALIDNMTAGNTYVNVHTVHNPGGEIRGQITVVSPAQAFSISGFKINNDTGSSVPGWPINLTNATTGELLGTNTTDGNGMYLFTGLANGTYNVTEGMMEGWTPAGETTLQVTIDGADMPNQNFTNALIPVVTQPTSFLLTPDTSVVLKGTTININVMALNGSLPQPLFNGIANITITADNASQVTFDQIATFVNGNATIELNSSVAQFVTITATNDTTTGSTMVEFADMVITLTRGYNLISIPSFANPSDITLALQLVQNNGVQSFNPATGLFVTPTDLHPLFGYWINVTADNQKLGFIADTSIVIVPPTRNLFEGWNLIGVSANRNELVSVTPNSTFADLRNGDQPSQWLYSRLVSFDEGTRIFTTYTAGVDITLDSPQLELGHGHWLFIKGMPNTNKNNVPWAGKLW